MKLAFIVQRYGREILGGSETLARQLAERLARRHEITVLTTTALDYITWKNHYEPGETKERGVRVRRRCCRPRSMPGGRCRIARQ